MFFMCRELKEICQLKLTRIPCGEQENTGGIIQMLSNIIMNSVYCCLLIEAALFIFKYRLRWKGYLLLYIIPTVHYLFSYQAVKKHPSQELKDYVIFFLCCGMEYAIMIATAFLIEYEEVYLATVILMIYVPAANMLLLGLCSLSKKLSEAQRAYLISYENVRILPALLIILLTLLSGWLCSLIFAVLYQKLKRKNRLFYQILMLLILSVMVVSSAVKHNYYYVARNSSMKSRMQIAGVSLVMFVVNFVVLNLLIYFYNRYEIRQLKQENSQTQRFVNALQQQYAKVEQSNRDMKQLADAETQGKKLAPDQTEKMIQTVSLTGNLMLDTLFTYYSHLAREKNVVFEIQSELADGKTVKSQNYEIGAGTQLLDVNVNI